MCVRSTLAPLTFALVVAASGSAAAQDEFEVRTSVSTPHFPEAPAQPGVGFTITKKTLGSMLITGTALALTIPGVSPTVATYAGYTMSVVKFESLAAEALDEHGEERRRAYFLDPRMKRLEEIKTSGETFQSSDEAKKILGEIRAQADQGDGAATFALKAAFENLPYVVARDAVWKRFSKFFGGRIARSFGVHEHTAAVLNRTEAGRAIRNRLIHRPWDVAKSRAELAKDWTKKLDKELVKLAMSASYKKAFREQFDTIYERVMGDHPSTRHAVYSPDNFRVTLAVAPQAMIPVMVAPQIVLPAVMPVYHDPVVAAVANEAYLINVQPTPVVSPRQPPASNDPPSRQREPDREPLNIRPPNIGTPNWDGRRFP